MFRRTEYWLQRVRESHRTSEYREKMSRLRKGIPLSPEHRLALSKAKKGKSYPHLSTNMKGKKLNLSPEAAKQRAEKIRQAKLGKPRPLLQSTIEKRLKEKEEKWGVTKDIIEFLYMDYVMTMREIAELLSIPERVVCDFMWRYKIPRRTHQETLLLRPDLLEIWKRNTTAAAIQNWKNFRNDPIQLEKWAKSFSRKPTRIEIKLEKLLQTNNLPYKYVGNGEVVIGYWNPDFINTNGKKKLIELFGNYWHRMDDPQKRIDKFRKYGFETLVIWESELKNPEQVVHKIDKFTNSALQAGYIKALS